MNRISTIFALAAAAALAGCNSDQDAAAANGANAAANVAEPIKLPPAIVGSHRYRCKDNSLIAIDWLSDGTANSARVTPEGGATVSLTQAEADGPYTAEGASLTGDSKAQSVTYKGQSCKR